MNTKICKQDYWNENEKIGVDRNFGITKVTVPARIDFIGGWTDMPPYYFDYDAAVLNSTLAFFPSAPKTRKPDYAMKVVIRNSDRFCVTENSQTVKLKNNFLISEILKFLSLKRPKIHIFIFNIIPVGSGLGGSSLYITTILSALLCFYEGFSEKLLSPPSLKELINDTLMIEQKAASGGGWQDQIGGIFPGVKLIETFPGRKNQYKISFVEDYQTVKLLNDSLLMIDSNIQRKFSMHSLIREKILSKDKVTLRILRQICFNARLGYKALCEKKYEMFWSLLTSSWDMVNKAEGRSAITEISVLKKLCGGDLVGLKMAGAGGGGFILAAFRDSQKKDYYSCLIRKLLPSFQVYKPILGKDGLVIKQKDVEHKIKKMNNL